MPRRRNSSDSYRRPGGSGARRATRSGSRTTASSTAGPDVELAVPYGVYDLSADTGWVNVGVDHDTSAFAVASIRRWWQARGVADYPEASRLLITADAGGSWTRSRRPTPRHHHFDSLRAHGDDERPRLA